MSLNKIKNSSKFKKVNRFIKLWINNSFIDNKKYLPPNIDRVYHVHIRKSGGTSLNNAFWKLGGYTVDNVGSESLLIGRNRSFVRLNKELINEGNYFYASSHFPIWELILKPNTYTYTVLREPLARLISLYKYYKWVEITPMKEGLLKDPSFKVLKSQENLLNKNFTEFVDVLSNKYLYGNLYMFSKDLDVDEGLDKLKSIDRVLFQHNLNNGFKKVSSDLNLELTLSKKLRKFNNKNFNISENDLEYVKLKIENEIIFYQSALKRYESV